MGQYFLDFATDSRDNTVLISEFSVTTNSGTAFVGIYDDAGTKCLRAYRTGSNPVSGILISALGAANADVDMYVRMKTSLTTSYRVAGLALRANYVGTALLHYNSVVGGASANETGIHKRRASSFFARGDALAAFAEAPIAQGEWHWRRFQVIGTTVRVKIWAGVLANEPGTWFQSSTDSELTAGSVGFLQVGGSTTIGDLRVSYIAVGTNGDPAPTSGAPADPPAGTVTISGVTPGQTSAVVTYSYGATDQTGFEYRIDGDTAASIGASPATITGLTAATEYDVEVRAINASGAGVWSAVSTFTTNTATPGNTAPTFSGPNIDAISGTEAVALSSLDVSARFSDAESSLAFSVVGTWPAGVTVSSAGVISGTPTTAGTYAGLQVRATDAGSLTADSNAFTITVAAPTAAGVTVTEPLKNNTGTLLASQSGVRVAVLQAIDLVSVHEQTGLSTNASGLLPTISDATIVPATSYHVVIKLADGSVGITGPITAS